MEVLDDLRAFKINRLFKCSNSGSKFERLYKYKSIDGVKTLVFDKTKNVYDIIQSYKDDNNIYKILNRVMQGDYSALDKNQGSFADYSKMPTNINDLNDFLLNTENQFNVADPKFKALFDNSYSKMIDKLQKGEFDKIYLNYLNENHPEIIKRNKEYQERFNESISKVVKEELKKGEKVNE